MPKLSEKQIRAGLDDYLEKHYGREPVLSLAKTNDYHKLKFHLVDETVTLTSDDEGNITEKRTRRRLSGSAVEGQLSLSDMYGGEPETEEETPEEDVAEEAEAESPEPVEAEPAEETAAKAPRTSRKKRGGGFAEGEQVVNIYTGSVYTVISSEEGIARVRPVGELSTLMLSESDLRSHKEV